MSKIQQFGRPFETFDPSNKKHRKIFHDVLRYRTWGRSAICFWSEDDSTGNNSLMDQCVKAISTYYMEKEFDGDYILESSDSYGVIITEGFNFIRYNLSSNSATVTVYGDEEFLKDIKESLFDAFFFARR